MDIDQNNIGIGLMSELLAQTFRNTFVGTFRVWGSHFGGYEEFYLWI
jgi:hypothetical protein